MHIPNNILVISLIIFFLSLLFILSSGQELQSPQPLTDLKSALTLSDINSFASAATPISEISSLVSDEDQQDQNTDLSDQFYYPNSEETNTDTDQVTWESSDDPKVITEWYKQKIKELDFNTTAFVQTNTNNEILNKLVGANENKQVRVEISRGRDSRKTTIVFQNES